jgi:hypothetical protein
MGDGIGKLFTRLNDDGDVLVGRLKGVLLLCKGAHAKQKERREEEFFHDGEILCRQK